MNKYLPLLLAVSLLPGCSDDEESQPQASDLCSITVELTGAVEESIAFGIEDGCASSSANGQVGLSFNVNSPTVLLSFGEVTAGETATGLDASFRYLNADFDEWNNRDCSIDLTRNELVESNETFGDSYALEGTGSCTGIAEPSGGEAEGEITVGDFQFEATASID